jgi:hypothetical protein
MEWKLIVHFGAIDAIKFLLWSVYDMAGYDMWFCIVRQFPETVMDIPAAE